MLVIEITPELVSEALSMLIVAEGFQSWKARGAENRSGFSSASVRNGPRGCTIRLTT